MFHKPSHCERVLFINTCFTRPLKQGVNEKCEETIILWVKCSGYSLPVSGWRVGHDNGFLFAKRFSRVADGSVKAVPVSRVTPFQLCPRPRFDVAVAEQQIYRIHTVVIRVSFFSSPELCLAQTGGVL